MIVHDLLTTSASPISFRHTQLDKETRDALLVDLSERYTPEAYSLFSNNCNNFTDEFAQLLVGQGIPAHITGLPAEVLETPFGRMLQPALAGLERQLGAMGQQPAVPGQEAAPAAGRTAAQALGAQVAAALARATSEEPVSPRSLERDVGAAIAKTMIEEHHQPEHVAGATEKDQVEAEVEEEARRLATDAKHPLPPDEAAAEALRHEADKLSKQDN